MLNHDYWKEAQEEAVQYAENFIPQAKVDALDNRSFEWYLLTTEKMQIRDKRFESNLLLLAEGAEQLMRMAAAIKAHREAPREQAL